MSQLVWQKKKKKKKKSCVGLKERKKVERVEKAAHPGTRLTCPLQPVASSSLPAREEGLGQGGH